MIHDRERLPFRLKTRDYPVGVHSELDDLDRHLATNRGPVPVTTPQPPSPIFSSSS
jgi:hypothetical protein